MNEVKQSRPREYMHHVYKNEDSQTMVQQLPRIRLDGCFGANIFVFNGRLKFCNKEEKNHIPDFVHVNKSAGTQQLKMLSTSHTTHL